MTITYHSQSSLEKAKAWVKELQRQGNPYPILSLKSLFINLSHIWISQYLYLRLISRVIISKIASVSYFFYES